MGDSFKEGAVTGVTKYDDVWLSARDGFARAVLGDPRGTGRVPPRYMPTLRAFTFRFFERGSKRLKNHISTLSSNELELEKALNGKFWLVENGE
jgi:hypothetical protein